MNKLDELTMKLFDDNIESSKLTFVAENIGSICGDSHKIINKLIQLLKHDRPIVREGALYGLYHHLDKLIVRTAFQEVLNNDGCAAIREVAKELLS